MTLDVFGHQPPTAAAHLTAVLVSSAVAGYGLKRNSLSRSGAALAMVVGYLTSLAGFRFFAVLLFFFLSSSKLTKFGAKQKQKLEDGFVEGGRRTAMQVFCNGGVATMLAYCYVVFVGGDQPCLDRARFPLETAICAAFVGHYACCNGDTWASELGILSKTPPRLITTFKPVPAGTNGGISLLGTGASVAGGASIGAVMWLAWLLRNLVYEQLGHHELVRATDQCPPQWPLIVLGLVGGLVGSIVDSLLGALLQISFYDSKANKIVAAYNDSTKHISGIDVFDNHQVNFLSAFVTSMWIAYVGLLLF
ncbi:hypothetical protein, variant [Capsaspora owczarzaki ATCC 30864]|uniref:Transmembrane protein 19 n=1 Tax=Capsaspora owczarzaki (strain ATCC 30864) TaxID=595528 RepID=A0A0D2WKB5_CAPO3|nr:hypothetical protein, variant [Capsaspora owczarzaki ATCC 30864]KJE90655.1 hypothetical protein CAOG_001930 [Capsaspora owczarzaki ATCC 30864]|eukprot:XP_011270064.1 hypothetical protein, variant [Capsaspora owczarzaki ATCC 30864]